MFVPRGLSAQSDQPFRGFAPHQHNEIGRRLFPRARRFWSARPLGPPFRDANNLTTGCKMTVDFVVLQRMIA
jgi:hypothetical protein